MLDDGSQVSLVQNLDLGQKKKLFLKGAIPDDERFDSQLAAPGYHINNSGQLVIESKANMSKRGAL